MSVAEVHCVALGMPAGASPSLNSIPVGMSKLLSIWNVCLTASSDVSDFGAVA